MNDASPVPTGSPPYTQTREFWLMLAYAVVLGVLGALVGLVFLGIVGFGGGWYDDTDPGWFGGEWWWVAVTAAAGLAVGVLHRLTHLPDKTPGLIVDLKKQHTDPSLVPGILVVSAVSLMGGASIGPEKALGSAIGGAGSWLSDRRGLGEDFRKTNTLNGFAGAFGGLLSSPLVVLMLVLEVARPGGERAAKVLMGGAVASSVSFGIYFAIAGTVFLDLFKVPQYEYEGWHLLVGIGLGVLAAVLVMIMIVVITLVGKLFARLPVPSIVHPVIGGILFGLIGVALPLTLFTGTDQINTALESVGTLGAALLVVTVFAKMLTFAISSSSGFVGGAIFPTLFIGGVTGIAVHEIFPDIPLALAFTCLLAAVPGALVTAPFTMVLLAALLTQIGPLQTAPVLVAVVTAMLTMYVANYVVDRQKRAAPPQAAAPPN